MHKQCPHGDQSGWGIVEVVAGFCEVGNGCEGLKVGCPYAWAETDRKATRRANKAFDEFAKRLESRLMS